ncbi:nucleoside hydrolase [Chloroflexota bacterium]
MKSKFLKITGIVIGVLILMLLLAGPILTRLGVETFCISGEFPDLQFDPCVGKAVVRPTLTPYPLPTAASEDPIPIIFDDDGSPDGIIALLYFLNNPLYDVRAVTVSQGEAHPQLFAQHIAQLLAGFGREDIPVGFGREAPLEGENAFPEPWREASDLFFEIPLSESPTAYQPRPAAELIIEMLINSNDPMLVFISGTHTNLAEAFRIDPDIKENILGAYIMGGSIYVPGNIESDWPEIHNSVAEWNIWADPQAAREVFASGIPLHLIPIDATNQITWTKIDAEAWKSSTIPETIMAGKFLDWMLRSWSLDAAYIWDLVAAVVATDPRLCPEVQLALDVNIELGPDQGQTVLTDETSNVLVCLEPDSGQIRARVEGILINVP